MFSLLCSLSAASCIGKFHPSPLGLRAALDEIIDAVRFILLQAGELSQREWEKRASRGRKGTERGAVNPRTDRQVTNPQEVRKVFGASCA